MAAVLTNWKNNNKVTHTIHHCWMANCVVVSVRPKQCSAIQYNMIQFHWVIVELQWALAVVALLKMSEGVVKHSSSYDTYNTQCSQGLNSSMNFSTLEWMLMFAGSMRSPKACAREETLFKNSGIMIIAPRIHLTSASLYEEAQHHRKQTKQFIAKNKKECVE